ncbi:MAG: protealysin inhibitor emfourin [Terriglobales bacterium]
MRILVERSGGFAGISQTNSLSTDQVPAQEAKKIADLVEAAGFFELPAVIESNGPGGDRFQYKITVESERGAHTVNVDEAAVPAGLEPVLVWMKSRARSGK